MHKNNLNHSIWHNGRGLLRLASCAVIQMIEEEINPMKFKVSSNASDVHPCVGSLSVHCIGVIKKHRMAFKWLYTIMAMLFVFPCASKEFIEKYNKNYDYNIDWDKNACDESFFLKNNVNQIEYKCAVLFNELPITYLKDKSNVIYKITGFVPVEALKLSNGILLHLYSEENISRLFIEITNNSTFDREFVVDGQVLVNSNTRTLMYQDTLVWLSGDGKNKCSSDFEKKLGYQPGYLSFLALHTPSKINYVSLIEQSKPIKPVVIEDFFNDFNKLNQKAKPEDFRYRFFVFLAINAESPSSLDSFVRKYKKALGNEVIDLYQNTPTCIDSYKW